MNTQSNITFTQIFNTLKSLNFKQFGIFMKKSLAGEKVFLIFKNVKEKEGTKKTSVFVSDKMCQKY